MYEIKTRTRKSNTYDTPPVKDIILKNNTPDLENQVTTTNKRERERSVSVWAKAYVQYINEIGSG